MLIAINHTPKTSSKVVRALIGRYLWRVGRDTWIWPKSSIRYDLLEQLKQFEGDISVELYWKQNSETLGFSYQHIGQLPADRNSLGLYLHTSNVYGKK